MSSPSLILAHDLGTTGNKASLFDAQGVLVASALAGYATAYPQANWAEQKAEDWLRAVVVATQHLLSQSQIDPAAIAAVTFSGQMMGCLPVDAQGQPLRSCMIWADQRSQRQAEELAAACGAQEVYRVSGHRPSAAYSAPKILWLRQHQPEIYAAAASFLQPKDFVIYKLTDQLVTDYSDASGTLLFNLETRRWHQPFLDALDLPIDKLPTPFPSTTVVGHITAQAAAEPG